MGGFSADIALAPVRRSLTSGFRDPSRLMTVAGGATMLRHRLFIPQAMKIDA
jgi:hypothetical protein